MDNKTPRKIILDKKADQSLVPDDHFVTNLRKVIKNKIDSVNTSSANNKALNTKDKSNFFKNLFTKKRLSYFLVLLITIITGVVVSLNGPFNKTDFGTTITREDGIQVADIGKVQITPEAQNSLGVDPKSAFIVTTTKAAKAEELKAKLKVEPSTKFKIQEESDKKFKITFDKELEKDKIYNFQLATQAEQNTNQKQSWAFQIANKSRIIQTLPRNKSTNVPLNTGIEIVFSHESYAENYSEYFEITPKVDGRFERHKKTLSFIPKSLKEQTLYTVKLKKGFVLNNEKEALLEDYIFQFETKPTKGFSPDSMTRFFRDTTEFSTAENPAFTVVSLPDTVTSIKTDLYEVPNSDQFLNLLKLRGETPNWAYYTKSTPTTSTTNLKNIGSYDLEIKKFQENTSSLGYIELPNKLKQGYYIVESQYENKKFQTLLQITNLSTYISVSDSKTLAWVNDVSTGKPSVNASVQLIDTNLISTTNEQGAAFLDTPKEFNNLDTSKYIKVTSQDGKSVITKLNIERVFWYGNIKTIADDYWSHVYFDRPIYQPTDSIKYWGVLRNRDINIKGEKLKAKLIYNEYLTYSSPSIIWSGDVETNDSGIFTGEIPFKNLKAGFYSLEIRKDEEVITNNYLEIVSYKKPTYKIDVSTNKKAVRVGEEVIVKGKVSFFEGTGVSGVTIKYQGSVSGEVISDSNGNFEVKYSATRQGDIGPSDLYFTPLGSEEGDISTSSSVMVFDTDVAVRTEQSISNGQAKVTLKAYSIDFSRINNGTAKDTTDYLGTPLQNYPVNGQLFDEIVERIETGEEYDFISKTTRKTYRYNNYSNLVNPISLTTDQKGEAIFQISFPSDKIYKVILGVQDKSNKFISNTSYLYGNSSPYSYQDYRISLKKQAGKYKIDEKETASFYNGNSLLPSGGANRFLFLIKQGGLKDFKVQDNPQYNITFDVNHAPNFYIKGVYFNGRTYVESQDVMLDLDETQQKFNIDIKTDKQFYKPGETVNLEINSSGVPADINVSVVDEALFAVQDQQLNMLGSLYKDISPGNLYFYSSHKYPSENDMFGGKGSTSGNPRGNFKDRAFFESIRTDANGFAKVSFKLPDNLTSWRITYQGLTNEKLPRATNGSKQLIVKQPFFIDPVINSSYLVSDKPSIKLRTFGEELKSGSNVDLQIDIPTLNVTGKTITAKAYEEIIFPLPDLKEGEHKITIRAKSGALEDAIVKTINVINSRTLKTTNSYSELSEGIKLNGSKNGRTTLIFSDQNRGKYFYATSNLMNSYGDRFDQKFARYKSAELYKKYFDEQSVNLEDLEVGNYQTENGGISLLPYSDDDLELSAKIADLSNEEFNKNFLKQYFNSVLNNKKESRERSIIAFYGLASLNEPVLLELNNIKNTNDLNAKEKIYLALAFSKLGDFQSGRDLLDQVIKTSGEDMNPYLRIKYGNDQDDYLEITSLAAYLASIVEDSRSNSLFDYINNNQTSEILTYLEMVGYLQYSLPKLSSESVKFNYALDGKTETKELKKGELFKLNLSSEQLQSIKFSNIEGKVGVITEYEESLNSNEILKDNSISITRSYSVNGKTTTEFKQSDIVKVTLDYKVANTSVDGCYQVTDVLPSGFEVITQTYTRGIEDKDQRYPYDINDKNVSFCVWKGEKTQMKPIIYYARISSIGEFKAEPTVIQSTKSAKSINISTDINVKILK